MNTNGHGSKVPTVHPLRVAILTTHPIQYQAPLWRALAKRSELKVHVFFGTDMSVRGYRDEGFGVQVKWDVPLMDGYEHTFVSRDPSIERVNFWRPTGTGLARHLSAFRPDVVLLTAYNSRFLLAGFRWAWLHRVPVVMRHEASDEAQQRSPLKSFVRDTVLRLFYSRIAGFAAIGTQARAHLLRVGVKPEKIGSSPYCVDSDQLEAQVQRWRPRRDELREELGAKGDDFVLIFSGKLIEKKQPLLIPRAVALLPAETRERIHLIVMGDGEQRAALEQEGREVFGKRLHMAGFVNQSEIGRWYAAADCLVLPSKRGTGETWGLVVNEALQFGIPAIVSDGVGCRDDLIDDESGWVFRGESADALADAIQKVTQKDERLSLESSAGRKKVSGYSLARATDGLASALCSCAPATLEGGKA